MGFNSAFKGLNCKSITHRQGGMKTSWPILK